MSTDQTAAAQPADSGAEQASVMFHDVWYPAFEAQLRKNGIEIGSDEDAEAAVKLAAQVETAQLMGIEVPGVKAQTPGAGESAIQKAAKEIGDKIGPMIAEASAQLEQPDLAQNPEIQAAVAGLL